MKSQGKQEGSIVTWVLFLLSLNFLKDGQAFLLVKWTPKLCSRNLFCKLGSSPNKALEALEMNSVAASFQHGLLELLLQENEPER